MSLFITKLQKRGKSLTISIPQTIIEGDHLKAHKQVRVIISPIPNPSSLMHLFGSLPFKRPTQEIMDELDEEERQCLARNGD